MDFIKRWLSDRERRKRDAFASRINSTLRFMGTESNEGLLRRRLINMPEVVSVSTDSGGWRKASVDVRMRDGYETCTYEHWMVDALRLVACKVAKRLFEKYNYTEEESCFT